LSARRRLVVLLVATAAIVGLVLLVSNNVWRGGIPPGGIPRSTIAAVAIGLEILFALWLFGARGSSTALAILTAIGAVLITAGAAIDWDQVLAAGPPPDGALVDCPERAEGSFDGVVAPTELGYAHLRDEANLYSTVLLRYPPGCELALDGYCLGEPKDDWRFDTQDPVWFRVAAEREDGEPADFIASADLKAGPGSSVKEVPCPGQIPDPGRPEITAPLGDRLDGPVEFAAAVPGAIQVGFAVHYDDAPGPRSAATWHQIGVDLDTGDGITMQWDSRSVPGQSGHRAAAVTLMVVPCLGLEFPFKRHVERTYMVANRNRVSDRSRLSRSVHGGSAARELACDNADR
jgi:hypothetical protein